MVFILNGYIMLRRHEGKQVFSNKNIRFVTSLELYIYILNFVCVSVAQLLPKASNDIGLKASDRLTYRLTEWFKELHFAAKKALLR